MSPSDKYRAELRGAFPASFLREVAACLNMSYRVARERTAEFPDGILHDLLPQYRHAVVQSALLILARKYSGRGVIASSELNVAENSYHTLIRSGDVVLTESPVPTPNAVVRRAIFRESYAVSNQLDLYRKDKRPAADAPLYALIVHGPGALAKAPSFAKIVFPLPDLTGYVDDGIDLIHAHLADTAAHRNAVEQIADEVALALRRGVAKKAPRADA